MKSQYDMNTISVIFFCCNGKNSHLQPDKVDLIFLKGSSDLDFCGRQSGFSHALIGVYEQAGGKRRKEEKIIVKHSNVKLISAYFQLPKNATAWF